MEEFFQVKFTGNLYEYSNLFMGDLKEKGNKIFCLFNLKES